MSMNKMVMQQHQHPVQFSCLPQPAPFFNQIPTLITLTNAVLNPMTLTPPLPLNGLAVSNTRTAKVRLDLRVCYLTSE